MGRTERWHVYILECADGRLYTGITNDVEKRMDKHKNGRGARFTRIFGFKQLLYTERLPDKIHAIKRELEIKRWPRKKKMLLVDGKMKEQ